MPQLSLLEREERTVVGRMSESVVLRKAVNGWGRLRRLLTTLVAPPSGIPKEMVESTSGSELGDFGWADVLRADAGLPARMM